MPRASVPSRLRPLRDPDGGSHLAVRRESQDHGRGRLGLLRLGDGLGAPRPHHGSREPAPRQHLSSPALHPRHGRAGAGDDPPGPAPLALHPGRGLHLQPPSPADIRPVGLDHLLARPRASDAARAPPSSPAPPSPSRPSAPIRSPTSRPSAPSGSPRSCSSCTASRARVAPETRSWRRSSSCWSSWPAGTTASSASRSCPLGALVLLWGRLRERLPAAILATGLAGLALLAALPHAPRGARARALLPRQRRDRLLLRGRGVVPGHELVEPGLGRGHRAVSDHRAQQPLPRSRGSRPGHRRRSCFSGSAASVRAATPSPCWPSVWRPCSWPWGPRCAPSAESCSPAPSGFCASWSPSSR